MWTEKKHSKRLRDLRFWKTASLSGADETDSLAISSSELSSNGKCKFLFILTRRYRASLWPMYH